MTKKLFRMILMLSILGTVSLLTTGCETAEGFGRDLEDAGEELQKAAD